MHALFFVRTMIVCDALRIARGFPMILRPVHQADGLVSLAELGAAGGHVQLVDVDHVLHQAPDILARVRRSAQLPCGLRGHSGACSGQQRQIGHRECSTAAAAPATQSARCIGHTSWQLAHLAGITVAETGTSTATRLRVPEAAPSHRAARSSARTDSSVERFTAPSRRSFNSRLSRNVSAPRSMCSMSRVSSRSFSATSASSASAILCAVSSVIAQPPIGSTPMTRSISAFVAS